MARIQTSMTELQQQNQAIMKNNQANTSALLKEMKQYQEMAQIQTSVTELQQQNQAIMTELQQQNQAIMSAFQGEMKKNQANTSALRKEIKQYQAEIRSKVYTPREESVATGTEHST